MARTFNEDARYKITKTLLRSHIGEEKRRGRPRERWQNEVENDLRQNKTRNRGGRQLKRKDG